MALIAKGKVISTAARDIIISPFQLASVAIYKASTDCTRENNASNPSEKSNAELSTRMLSTSHNMQMQWFVQDPFKAKKEVRCQESR